MNSDSVSSLRTDQRNDETEITLEDLMEQLEVERRDREQRRSGDEQATNTRSASGRRERAPRSCSPTLDRVGSEDSLSAPGGLATKFCGCKSQTSISGLTPHEASGERLTLHLNGSSGSFALPRELQECLRSSGERSMDGFGGEEKDYGEFDENDSAGYDFLGESCDSMFELQDSLVFTRSRLTGRTRSNFPSAA